MEPHDKYESQPFIDYPSSAATVVPLPQGPPPRRRRRRPKCAVCCCLCCLVLFLLIFPLVAVFYIWIWPSQCFFVLDDSAPIQLGINVQQSRLYIVFTKPIETGTFNSSLNFCGETTSVDTRFLPVLGGLKIPQANFSLKSNLCPNLPRGVDLNRGTLKVIIDGNNETNVSFENISVAFSAADLPKDGFFQLFSSENGIRSSDAKGVMIDFLEDGAVRFEPGIGVVYSKFQAVITTEILLLSTDSPNNYCGAPAVSITLDAGVFHKAWQAFKHWINYSFYDLSPIGISQHIFALVSLQLSEVELHTKPVMFKTETSVEPKHVPVFLKQGELQVAKSSVTLSNLSLRVDSSTKDNVHLRTQARIRVNLPLGDIDALASLKKRMQLTTSFRNAQFDLPFDIDISSNSNKKPSKNDSGDAISSKDVLAKLSNDSDGSFRMENITLQTTDNSSLFTPSLQGIVEPIYVRSSRELATTPDCKVMLYKFVSIDFVTSAMTVPAGQALKVIVAGSSPGSTPLTVKLYQMGRVANSMRMIVSSRCLDDRGNKSQEKRHMPRSEALMTEDGGLSYSYNFTVPGDDDSNDKGNGMTLEYFKMSAEEVDARVEPIGNFLLIDKILVKLNATDEKANLDLQVGLKQSPTPLRALL